MLLVTLDTTARRAVFLRIFFLQADAAYDRGDCNLAAAVRMRAEGREGGRGGGSGNFALGALRTHTHPPTRSLSELGGHKGAQTKACSPYRPNHLAAP